MASTVVAEFQGFFLFFAMDKVLYVLSQSARDGKFVLFHMIS
jgi:hypothetical protein